MIQSIRWTRWPLALLVAIFSLSIGWSSALAAPKDNGSKVLVREYARAKKSLLLQDQRLTRMGTFADRVAAVITKAQAKGKDTTAIEQALATFRQQRPGQPHRIRCPGQGDGRRRGQRNGEDGPRDDGAGTHDNGGRSEDPAHCTEDISEGEQSCCQPTGSAGGTGRSNTALVVYPRKHRKGSGKACPSPNPFRINTLPAGRLRCQFQGADKLDISAAA